MERVLLPMEPVEPRIANFFTGFIFADERLLARKRVSDSNGESLDCASLKEGPELCG